MDTLPYDRRPIDGKSTHRRLIVKMNESDGTPVASAALAGTLGHEGHHAQRAAEQGTADDEAAKGTKTVTAADGSESVQPNPAGHLEHSLVYCKHIEIECEASKCLAMEDPPITTDCDDLESTYSKKLHYQLLGIDAYPATGGIFDGAGLNIGDVKNKAAHERLVAAKKIEMERAIEMARSQIKINCLCE